MFSNRAFWTLFGVTITIIVIALVIIIVENVLIFNTLGGYVYLMRSDSGCSSSPIKCGFINVNPAIPSTFIDDFDQPLALFCSQLLLDISHFQDTKTFHLSPSMQIIGTVRTKQKSAPVFGLVILDLSNKTTYVVFRGSKTMREWLVDFLFGQRPWNASEPLQGSIQDTDLMVHRGFIMIYSEIRQQVEDGVKNASAYSNRIVVTGHSLGAAMSSMFGLHFSSIQNAQPVHVYTFGKPRVGNQSYANSVNANIPGRFWRIENDSDAVVSVPTSVVPNLGNKNQPYVYQDEGQSTRYEQNWETLGLNHHVNNYLAYLRSQS
jgi:triacylglycerol lipase